MIDEFKDMYGRTATFILRGKGYKSIDYSPRTVVSLELVGKVVRESKKYLMLEDICIKNTHTDLGDYKKLASFSKGRIKKRYILGAFEGPVNSSSNNK